jgi:hypothetical protein
MAENKMGKTVDRHSYEKKDGEWIIKSTYSIDFEPIEYNSENLDKVIKLVKNNLDTSLLSSSYKKENKHNVYYGHCYHSTQAIYYLMDTDKLVPYSGKDDNGELHWWLQDGDKIIDATSEQYINKGISPPYEKGKQSKWYGWKNRPHKRSLSLIKRVLMDIFYESI